jgi:CheY-like chemotaxis protein
MSAPALVMVVEDDVDLREALCDLLEEAGHRTVRCAGGEAALLHLRTEPRPPDVILLDLMMPGMSGWEFREEQLRDPALAAVPVVVMTASRSLKDYPPSVEEILLKPLQIDRLMEIVARYGGREAGRGTGA